ncbi:glycosyltransferase family 2 protein [Adhaeribacter pallidiroseus]|uniref:Glycosyltransferase 2-like domain-containing protein n=1 Tax=Adhaeribacter pallidiroseus TaxID=2072847 RepID=A0A369QDH5_9BACT|nr:glycosyltransferase family 2 protein [Adhaeribacter pallidiroseus]RDC62973.1 hypothetical protein AHMF7616_01572 [Adhaeribacter pallidiroseus]
MLPNPNEPKVYIILVNFNRWQDTLECLESIFKLTYSNYRVIVVDNNSENDSCTRIQDWANGSQAISFNKNFYQKTGIDSFPVAKPISFLFYNKLNRTNETDLTGREKLILIQSNANLGFAGGNNKATTFALHQGDADYFWYLNNDTVVNKEALTRIINFIKKEELVGKNYGIIGTKLLFYEQPELLQGIGGNYNKWSGLTSHVLENTNDKSLKSIYSEKAVVDYPIGASMVVTKAFIEEVGLMEEDYFLYFEELDWTQRAHKKGLSIISFLNCKVYHKESASIGNSTGKKSKIADFYNLRNRILISQRFFKPYLPLVYLGYIPVIFNRLKRKQLNRIKMIIGILWNPYQHYRGSK